MTSLEPTDCKNNYNILSFVRAVTASLVHFTAAKVSDIASSLLRKSPTILQSESAWHQNLKLMNDAQTRTNDPSLTNRIRFLAVNYLNKIAPSVLISARIIGWKFFESAFQVSPFSPYQYHRAFYRYRPDLSSSVNQRFALGDKSPLILTDTDQFTQFFPLKFVVLNRSNLADWASLVSQAKKQDDELLFDFTDELRNTILTEGNREKEESFSAQFAEIKTELMTLGDLEYLKQKATAIARVKFECQGEMIGGIKILPLFHELSPKNIIKTHPTLAEYLVEQTGIALGAVQLRRLVPEAFPLPNGVPNASENNPHILFEDKEAFLKALRFKELRSHSTNSHVEVLGNSLLNMLHGLFENISQEQWDKIDREPALRQIFQTVLSNIIDHLTTAKTCLEDDNKFIQAIELAHAELAILLELSGPFGPDDFQSIYLKQLLIIPESLRPHLKGGLGKTAETVFALTNVAAREINGSRPIVSAWCDDFYFEHACFLGTHKKLESVLQDQTIDHVDLYGCTFNPSIETTLKTVPYIQRNLIADIEKILRDKPNTKHLTIALDFTNDYVNSLKTENLLAHFEPLIKEGRLNFVLFGSGQKFDQLGMDHFYGSPFFMINNGADHWKPFDALLTAEVNKTDRLSNQWFCLLYKSAATAVDGFRYLFFTNARSILRQTPEGLAPAKKRNITVIPFDDKAEPTYVDVKIKGIFHVFKACLLIAYFYGHAVAENVKASVRGSFGFLHPNVTLIFADKHTTLRLHPGIVEQDNRAILNFLHSLV